MQTQNSEFETSRVERERRESRQRLLAAMANHFPYILRAFLVSAAQSLSWAFVCYFVRRWTSPRRFFTPPFRSARPRPFNYNSRPRPDFGSGFDRRRYDMPPNDSGFDSTPPHDNGGYRRWN